MKNNSYGSQWITLTFAIGVVVKRPRVVTILTVGGVLVEAVLDERFGSQISTNQNDESVIGADSGPIVRHKRCYFQYNYFFTVSNSPHSSDPLGTPMFEDIFSVKVYGSEREREKYLPLSNIT